MKDISHNMRYAGKELAICDHFCNKQARNTKFYHWFSHLEDKLLKTMCESCALREVWGYKYRQNKNYKKWIEN